jgi:hypothetical protein
MWRRTGLGTAINVWLKADGATYNRLTGLEMEEEHCNVEQTASIPVLNLGADWLANWSKLLSGRGHSIARGVRLPLHPEAPAYSGGAGERGVLEKILRSFHASTSPNARRLAAYCAAVPLTLPVLRLVQSVMTPHGSQPEIAEVLLSGLIQKTDRTPFHDDEIVYDFIPGAREQLLSSVTTSEVLFLLARITEFVSERIRHPFNFQAWLSNPAGVRASLESAPPEARYFAEISASTLRSVNGCPDPRKDGAVA